MRQEFERHRYVNQIGVVDMLLFQSHAEYQVGSAFSLRFRRITRSYFVRTFWWMIEHRLAYFQESPCLIDGQLSLVANVQ